MLLVNVRNLSKISILVCLGLAIFLMSISASASESSSRQTKLDDGYSFYFSGDYQQAEAVAKSLVGSKSDADGSATLLLAAVYQKNKQYKKAQNLLHNHDALAVLYKERIPREKSKSGRKWTDKDKILYYQLKGLSGRLRYHLGKRDEPVLNDLVAGLSFDDNGTLINNPDIEAMQFAALMLYSKEQYERAIFYWSRAIRAMKRLEISRGLTEADKEFLHATEYNIACAYSLLGNVEQSLIWLNKSLVYKPKQRIEVIKTDHDLDNLRGHKKFKNFINELMTERVR